MYTLQKNENKDKVEIKVLENTLYFIFNVTKHLLFSLMCYDKCYT